MFQKRSVKLFQFLPDAQFDPMIDFWLLCCRYCFSSSFNKENNADLKIDSKMLKNNADQKPETAKPSTNLSANKIIVNK